jgi:hypothetical protein
LPCRSNRHPHEIQRPGAWRKITHVDRPRLFGRQSQSCNELSAFARHEDTRRTHCEENALLRSFARPCPGPVALGQILGDRIVERGQDSGIIGCTEIETESPRTRQHVPHGPGDNTGPELGDCIGRHSGSKAFDDAQSPVASGFYAGAVHRTAWRRWMTRRPMASGLGADDVTHHRQRMTVGQP